jgi:dihydrodipicolinate synthase/N-acetylneuraminate lyase
MAHCDGLCLFAVMAVMTCCAKQTVKKVDAAGMAAACETAAVAGLKGQTVYASQGEAYQTPLQVST